MENLKMLATAAVMAADLKGKLQGPFRLVWKDVT